ncbi:MAG: translocation/assembly module TamB domain-containing protein [Bryobacteraceae bacterium]|nr:translocation/assembly module TamB domain-containing protein [Bryobacteraceae bacterium]
MTARRRWAWAAGTLAAALILAAGASLLVLRSEWFREKVRVKIIQVTEDATGGRVELQGFHYDWSAMTARVDGFTIHGLEPLGREPLAHIPSIELAIHVRSLLQRDVELRSLTIERPAVHIYVAEDGSTNLPSPRRPRAPGANVIEDLLRLRIGRLAVADGLLHYDSREIPLRAHAEQLDAVLILAGPETLAFTLGVGRFAALGHSDFQMQAAGTLGPRRVAVERVRVARLSSYVEGDAVIEDFRAPRVGGALTAEVKLHEWPELVLDGGRARLDGRFSYGESEGWRAEGRVNGESLRLELEDFTLKDARLAARFQWRPEELWLPEADVAALGGSWGGTVRVREWRLLDVQGEARAMPLGGIMKAARTEDFPWDALLTGPVAVSAQIDGDGFHQTVAQADVRVAPVEGQLALEGQVAGEWRQQGNVVRIESAHLATPSSRLSAEGVLGESVKAGLFSTNPRELEPALSLLAGRDVQLPIRLQGGSLQAQAVVDGPLASPRIQGSVQAERALWESLQFTKAAARFEVSERELELEQLRLEQNGATLEGRLRFALNDWKLADTAAFTAALQARGLRLTEVARQAGAQFTVEGTIDAMLDASGTLDAPRGTLRWQGRQVNIAGEKFAKLNGRLKAESAESVRLQGELELDAATLAFSGAYRHPDGDWRNGEAAVRLETKGFRLAQFETVRAKHEGADGTVALQAEAVFSVTNGGFALRRLNGVLDLGGIRDGKRALGALKVEARTDQQVLRLALSGRVDQTPLAGDAVVRLEPQYPADGSLRLADLPLATLLGWLETETPPLRGVLTAEMRWRGDLAEPSQAVAVVTVPRLEIAPEPDEGTSAQNFTLRNAGPLRFDVDANGVRVSSARLTGLDTSITIAGIYDFNSTRPWDISLSGTVNLGVLTNFEPDLLAGGVARISANLRGAANDPDVSGRMTIHDGSLFLRGLTNGLEQANGSIYFDRDRASIEKMTATTGGGVLSLGGFIGFGGGEWSYRLQAKAQGVRVRYPEGVSTTVNSDLSLTGSQNASLLSGLVTVQRSGFSSRGDFASLIAGSGNPIPVPATQNDFLRNLQFDIRVRTSPDATFQTDYTQDLQTEADLRVRGSLAKPVVLGSVNVNQGEINFFGNRYTISRGEILFYNTATIQPSINLDLETRIRGVVVYIGVSGPLTRLNVNYRSEPPLQSREILALLTVGRAPTATSTGLQQQMLSPSAQQTGAGTNMLAEASNTLLGGALSASVSSRVEKFFGVSRIKIDPNVTGVENIPQARLTIEQSLSRDITLTFSSNLSRSSQQIIRLEWDLSRQWSAIAVRDENGAFGVDFLFRKRFK